MNNEIIRNPKPPTERDLKMLEFMKSGNTLDNISAMKLFGCAGVRDMIYRCRQAGHIILHRDIQYTTNAGENKKYRQWYMTEPEIIPTGAKTEVNYRKEKSASQYADELIEKAKNHGAVQGSIFGDYQDRLKHA